MCPTDVALAVAVPVCVTVDVMVAVGVSVSVVVGVAGGVTVSVAIAVGIAVGVSVAVAVRVTVGVGVGDGAQGPFVGVGGGGSPAARMHFNVSRSPSALRRPDSASLSSLRNCRAPPLLAKDSGRVVAGPFGRVPSPVVSCVLCCRGADGGQGRAGITELLSAGAKAELAMQQTEEGSTWGSAASRSSR